MSSCRCEWLVMGLKGGQRHNRRRWKYRLSQSRLNRASLDGGSFRTDDAKHRFASSLPGECMHTDGMADVSILNPGRPAVDPIDFPAIEALAPTPKHETGAACVDGLSCDRRDVVSWTPELWWLLNWWTWLFPPSDESNAGTSPDSMVIYAGPEIRIAPMVPHGQAADLALNATAETEHTAPGPPEVGETILRTVNMGNGLIDLFA